MRRIASTVLLVSVSASACEGTEAKPVSKDVVVQAQAEEVQPASRSLTKFERKLASIPGGEPYNYCAVFGCVPCPAGGPCPPPQADSIIHCCNSDGICVHVQLMGDCDPDDYVVICNWGQSNADGSITCYE